jgi:hypothetical protein
MGTRESYGFGQSQYLRADEMVGKTIRATIAYVEDVEFDEKGLKPVLVLEGQDKKFVVNSTNFDVLAESIGNNTNDWTGHVILLKGEKVRFKGRLVDSVRVSMPKPQPKQAKHPTPPTDDLDDGVPDFPAA